MRRLSDTDRIDRAMPEDDLLSGIADLSHRLRWLSYHVRRSDRAVTQGTAGFPDLIMARPPRLLLIELKSQLGELAPLQQLWREALERCPGIEYYVWRPSDWRTGVIDKVLA
jgi:hypothetical protein